jgi:hypothetical protein
MSLKGPPPERFLSESRDGGHTFHAVRRAPTWLPGAVDSPAGMFIMLSANLEDWIMGGGGRASPQRFSASLH